MNDEIPDLGPLPEPTWTPDEQINETGYISEDAPHAAGVAAGVPAMQQALAALGDAEDHCPKPYSTACARASGALRAALASPTPPAEPPTEVREDGQTVRVDRWQVGIRRIVALLWGNRHEFEVDEVVEAVRKLIPDAAKREDDEELVKVVLTPPAEPVRTLTEAQLERHGMPAAECPPDSQVMLVSSIRRLLGMAAPDAAPPQAAQPPAEPAPIDLTDEWPTTRYFVKQVMAKFGIGPHENIA